MPAPEMAMGDFDVGWVAHAQVHGHLQAVGFAGLFVLGMGLRLAPRFGRGNVASIRAAAPGCAILVVGLLLRAVAQPLADHEVFGALLILGAALELTGAAIFIAIFMRILGKYPYHKVAAVSLGVMFVFFLMFEVWFKIPLFKGALNPTGFLGY